MKPAIISRLSTILATGWVTSVAAVSHLVPEAARGCEGHLLVLVQSYPALRVRLVESSKLFVGVRHYIGIAERFFQGVQVATPDC